MRNNPFSPAIRRAVQEAEARPSELEVQRVQLVGVEEDLENLVLQKERALLSVRHPLSAELQEINRCQQSLHAEKREIGEALQALLPATGAGRSRPAQAPPRNTDYPRLIFRIRGFSKRGCTRKCIRVREVQGAGAAEAFHRSLRCITGR